ncbi:hypothetical protein [Halomarina rubra]|uniref:Uncharacterized protein n=1 Tax=Halomarina rubra TaxID=2071873 RepID=A0ABD6AWB8_9EURY|nr:hypothetical protein [Halomarina rubra]
MRLTVPSVGEGRIDLDTGEVGMLAAGGFLGAALAGTTMQIFDQVAMLLTGSLVGLGSVGGGWLATLVFGVVLAVPFGAVVSGSINGFVNRVIVLSSQSDALQRVLVPLLNRSALAVTTSALGAGYGLVVGVGVYLVAAPVWATLAGSVAVASLVVPCLVGVVASVVYGATLGVVYGLLLEA